MVPCMEGPPSLSKITSNTTYMGITTESIYKQSASLFTTGPAHSQLRQSTAPPKHVIKTDQFLSFYATLGQRFLVEGDYNAKHCHWGSQLTTPKGRELFSAMQTANLARVSTGKPTYWPSDRRKVPDLIDFAVVQRIPAHSLRAESSFDLSSDHSPVLITLHSRPVPKPPAPTLSMKRTNWATFWTLIHETLTVQVPLETAQDIEDYVHHLVQTI